MAHAAAAVDVSDMTLWGWLERDGEHGPAIQAARNEKAAKRAQGVAMLRAGASNVQVSAVTGAPRTTIVKWRNVAEIEAPKRGKALNAERATVIAMMDAGATCDQAAEAVGVNRSTAAKWYRAERARRDAA